MAVRHECRPGEACPTRNGESRCSHLGCCRARATLDEAAPCPDVETPEVEVDCKMASRDAFRRSGGYCIAWEIRWEQGSDSYERFLRGGVFPALTAQDVQALREHTEKAFGLECADEWNGVGCATVSFWLADRADELEGRI